MLSHVSYFVSKYSCLIAKRYYNNKINENALIAYFFRDLHMLIVK